MTAAADRPLVALIRRATREGLRALSSTPADHASALQRIDQAQGAALAALGDRSVPEVEAALSEAIGVWHLLADALHEAAAVLYALDAEPGVPCMHASPPEALQ